MIGHIMEQVRAKLKIGCLLVASAEAFSAFIKSLAPRLEHHEAHDEHDDEAERAANNPTKH